MWGKRPSALFRRIKTIREIGTKVNPGAESPPRIAENSE